ncbi:MAG TPA: zinc ribbon domain-containing protein [Polyangium sp.]|nr:zinc ribbon domain-containing protein [Polyangium sp.]
MTIATTSPDCKACGANVPDGAAVCPRCGTSQRIDTCPLCGATTGCSPDPEFRYRCDVCGGPRVPLQAPRTRRGAKETAALKRAEATRNSRAKTRGGAFAAGLSAIGIIGMLGLAGIVSIAAGWNLGLWLFLAGLSTAGPLTALTAWLVSRSARLSKQIPIAIDEAWMAAAIDVVEQSKTPVTATSLAKALRIEESQAEELLALLEANDVVRPDGNLAYRALRVRVETPSTDTSERDLAAEAEAQAEAEALAVEQQTKRERL